MFNVTTQALKKLTRVRHVKAHDMSALKCLVAGEDRKSRCEVLQTTGEFIIDEQNELGFDEGPDSVRMLVNYGERKAVPHSILYETSSAPFDFIKMAWAAYGASDEMILKDGRVGAATQAVTEVQNDERNNKLGLILTILSTLFAIMCMIMVLT